MLENLVLIDEDKILEEVNNLKMYGYRFAAMTCDLDGDNLEFTAHFDKDYELKHLRFTVTPDHKIQSFSKIFPSALLIENEYQDLYGIEYKDLIIDYKGALYLAADGPKAPLANKKSGIQI